MANGNGSGSKWALQPGFLLALGIQTGAIIWFAAQQDERIEQLEEIKLKVDQGILPIAVERINSLERRINRLERMSGGRSSSYWDDAK